MTDEEWKRERHCTYQRGYYAGMTRAWPAHCPPVPPDPVVGRLVRALAAIADGVDGELAKLTESDEWVGRLGPLVDEAREALAALGHYLSSPTNPDGGQ